MVIGNGNSDINIVKICQSQSRYECIANLQGHTLF